MAVTPLGIGATGSAGSSIATARAWSKRETTPPGGPVRGRRLSLRIAPPVNRGGRGWLLRGDRRLAGLRRGARRRHGSTKLQLLHPGRRDDGDDRRAEADPERARDAEAERLVDARDEVADERLDDRLELRRQPGEDRRAEIADARQVVEVNA